MPLFNSQHQNDRGIRWREIAATAMVELLVLFALAFAVVRYVEWSSAVNQAEFMSATNPSSVDRRLFSRLFGLGHARNPRRIAENPRGRRNDQARAASSYGWNHVGSLRH